MKSSSYYGDGRPPGSRRKERKKAPLAYLTTRDAKADPLGAAPTTAEATTAQHSRRQRDPSAEPDINPGRNRHGQQHRKLSADVLRSDDDELGRTRNVRAGRQAYVPPRLGGPPDKQKISRGKSREGRGRDEVEETREETDNRRRRSRGRQSTERTRDDDNRQSQDRRKIKSRTLDDKAMDERLQEYKKIEEKINMYRPPTVALAVAPSFRNENKDLSPTSETTEDYTSQSGSSDDETKPPPPSKVYLLKGPGKHRAVDNESHLTLDSGVAEYQNSIPSPVSTKFRMLTDPDITFPSPKHRENLREWYHANRKKPQVKTLSTHMSTSDDDGSTLQTASSDDGALLGADLPNITRSSSKPSRVRTRQSIAYMSILLTVAQLLVLMLQVALCGLASFDINPMLGPYPDAFSEWGGKNPYLMLHESQWWRLVTSSFLHVGLLHLLANAFCQLEAIALFEREWGSFRWLLVYAISSVGCNAFSSLFDENSIAVGSSGTLMGLYAAKLAQVCCTVFFDDSIGGIGDDPIQLDQMSSILCGLTIVSLLSALTYIDWSGHMGGWMAGFLAGMVLFSCTIRRCCTRFLWSLLGFLGLVAGLTATIYFFIKNAHPYEELADPCEYFRSLFPEGYACGCMWQ